MPDDRPFNRNIALPALRDRPRRVWGALWALGLVVAVPLAIGPAQAQGQAAGAAAPAAPAASGPVIRPEAGKPLSAAQTALRAGNAREALARLAEAEALQLSPYENHVLRRLKAPALFSVGEQAQAMALFEGLLEDPLLAAQDRPPIAETTIKLALQQKDYPRALRWMKPYVESKGGDAEIRRLFPQVLSITGDHAGAAVAFKAQVAAEDAAGRAPTEQLLRMLASSQGQSGDDSGYLATLERLAVSTAKPDYWNELISRVSRRDGFNAERLRLDVYRLRQAVGVPLSAGEVGDMAFRANQAGLPAEAQKLLDEGFASKLLGQDSNAEADRKLREQATKAAAQDRSGLADAEASLRNARDGNAAFGLGFALSAAGQHDKALALMTQGQAKGGLRRPDDAMLHLGVAYWRAGKLDEAQKAFAAVGGNDGPADLARLWSLHLKNPPRR